MKMKTRLKLALAVLFAFITFVPVAQAQMDSAEYALRNATQNWTGPLYALSPQTQMPARQVGKITLRANQLQHVAVVERAANEYRIPIVAFKALVMRESGYKAHVVSHQGAVGLAQILPATWRAIGCTGNIRDAGDNAKCGAKYFAKFYHESGGNVHYAALRYHGGPNPAMHGPRTRAYAAAIAYGVTPRVHVASHRHVSKSRVASRKTYRARYAYRHKARHHYTRRGPVIVRYVYNARHSRRVRVSG